MWGNVGRFLGTTTLNDYSESNLSYRSMLNINVNRFNRIMNCDLGDIAITNKYLGIIFYCPKHEYEIILKAYTHMKNTARMVVALNRRNERLENWIKSKNNGAVLMALITLPAYVVYVIEHIVDTQQMKYAHLVQYIETEYYEAKDFKEANEITIKYPRLKHQDEI